MMCVRTELEAYRTFRNAARAQGLKLPDWIRQRLAASAQRDLAA